jgi:hypothetical protein
LPTFLTGRAITKLCGGILFLLLPMSPNLYSFPFGNEFLNKSALLDDMEQAAI